MAEHSTAQAQVTADHQTIREWAEERGGRPAAVSATHRRGDAGIIRLIFPDSSYADEDKLEEISWEEFFEKFEDANLALLYQETTSSGKRSFFSKLIDRVADRD
jgi:hypothetical protein